MYHALNEEVSGNTSLAKSLNYQNSNWIIFKNKKLEEIKKSLLNRESNLRKAVVRDDCVRQVFGDLMEEIHGIYGNQTVSQTIIAVIDNSSSMKRTDPTDLRKQALKLMADSLPEDTAMGVVGFSNKARVLAAPVRLGGLNSTARQNLLDSIDQIRADGGTNIQTGLASAGGSCLGRKNVIFVLLTDGQDSRWNGILPAMGCKPVVHSVGLSSQVDTKGLGKISLSTGGISEMASTSADLNRIVANLFGTATGGETLALEEGTIKTGETVSCQVQVEPGQGVLETSVRWPGSNVNLSLIRPDGRRISIADAVAGGFGVERSTYDLIRIKNPAPGTWQVTAKGVELAPMGEPFTLRITAKKTKIRTRFKLSSLRPERGDYMTLALSCPDPDVQWDQGESWVWAPGRKTPVHTVKTVTSVESFLGGGQENKLTLWEFRPKVPGVYRIKTRVTGKVRNIDLQRVFDGSFKVMERGSTERVPSQIDPFIRRN